MTDNETPSDLKQGFNENCLADGLVSGPRKSGIVAQFMGRINRRNMPAPVTMLIAPTGKAHGQLQRHTGQSSREDEVQKVDEEPDPGILKPKFW